MTLPWRLKTTRVATPVLFAVAGSVGCSRLGASSVPVSPPGVHVASAVPATHGDSALTLEAWVERLIIGGAEPLFVTYVVRNHGAPRRFANDALRYVRFDVVAPSGRLLRPMAADWEPPLVQDYRTLPAGGLVGQSVNLRCAENPYWPSRSTGAAQRCLWWYVLSEPGEYRIVVRYRAPTIHGVEGLEALELTSDTVRVTYHPN